MAESGRWPSRTNSFGQQLALVQVGEIYVLRYQPRVPVPVMTGEEQRSFLDKFLICKNTARLTIAFVKSHRSLANHCLVPDTAVAPATSPLIRPFQQTRFSNARHLPAKKLPSTFDILKDAHTDCLEITRASNEQRHQLRQCQYREHFGENIHCSSSALAPINRNKHECPGSC